MIRDLELVIEWLDNLEATIGPAALLDAMPNGWEGRIALHRRLSMLQSLDPDSPWIFDPVDGQIRDRDGWALATVPHAIAGTRYDLANGQLMAAAPVLAAHLRRLAGCLAEAAAFAVATAPDGRHNAGMWHTASREARALLEAIGHET